MAIRTPSIRIVSGVFLVLSLASSLSAYTENKGSHKVCFNGYCFRVELAITESEREKGLMFRDHLALNNGMLFVYKHENIYPFWMKNTKIPLDMIWINGQRQVVFIEENVSPCGSDECVPVYPDKRAKYVLEINSGSARKIGLKPGDKLSFYNIPQLF